MAYAAETKAPVSQTQAEIRAMLNKAGADSFGLMEERDRVHLAFELANRKIRFTIPMPARVDTEAPREKNSREKLTRSRWRALMLVIRAKLESVEANIETMEEAFLSQVQMPSGRTVYEELKAPIALEYKNKSGVPLLPGPR